MLLCIWILTCSVQVRINTITVLTWAKQEFLLCCAISELYLNNSKTAQKDLARLYPYAKWQSFGAKWESNNNSNKIYSAESVIVKSFTYCIFPIQIQLNMKKVTYSSFKLVYMLACASSSYTQREIIFKKFGRLFIRAIYQGCRCRGLLKTDSISLN